MANLPLTRTDPIRTSHYRPLELTETVLDWLFYLGAALSFSLLVINQKSCPTLYSAAIIFFVLIVVCNFLIGIASRLYFFPRADDARRKEFLSNAFGFDLTHQRTVGYYNNDEVEPLRRLGVSSLEDLFFTKAILRKMAPAARFKAVTYLVAWLFVALWREMPLDWVSAGAQVLFSEAILSYWLRLEWARSRAEHLYDTTHKLFQINPPAEKLTAYSIAAFCDYEYGKALGGILLSQKIFDRENKTLSAEWEIVKSGLPLSRP